MPKSLSILLSIAVVIMTTNCKSKKEAASGNESFRNIPQEASKTVATSSATDTTDYFDRDYIRLNDHTYTDEIKTVLLYPAGAPLSPPVLYLNDGKRLQLSFDDLAAGHKEFSYRIQHCTAGWEPSALILQEYVNGFNNDLITKSSSSENTLMEYTHYRYEFPNDYFQLTKSGNYMIHVYYGEQIILSKRFIVVENRVGIVTNLKQPTLINDRSYKQELDLVIQHPAYEILDPYKSLKVVIVQNGRWDNAVHGMQPNFVKSGELIYDYDEINVFEGGNEYRGIDLKNLKFRPSMIQDFVVENDHYYHAYLMPDEPRSYLRYSTIEDINGRFLIKKDDANDPGVEAEYIYVHFSLPYSVPESTGDIYIYGQLSDWQLKEDFKMIYDYEKKQYARTILLKQGYYNYNYAFLEDYKKMSELSVVEGTHFETENDYSVFVYYRQPGDNYDRCIGVKNLNSIKKN